MVRSAKAACLAPRAMKKPSTTPRCRSKRSASSASLGITTRAVQSDKLLDELTTSARPGVAEAVVQLRFFSKFRVWDQLSDAQKKAAFERLVADVTRTGLSRNQAGMIVQITNRIDDTDGKLVAPAIASLIPVAQKSKEPEVRRMAAEFEGLVGGWICPVTN